MKLQRAFLHLLDENTSRCLIISSVK